MRPFAVRSRPAVRATRNAPEYARSGSLYGHSKREFDALMRKVKLRQDTVRTLPYLGERNSQCICWDDEIPCFGLRVYPTGRRTYVVSYRVNQRKRLAKLDRAEALPLAEARRRARAFLGQVADRQDPQARPMIH